MGVQYRAVGWNRQKRVYDALIAAGVLLHLGLFIGCGFALHPRATAETMLIRALGTCAFLMLHVVLSIGPLCRIDRRFLPLLYNRRHLGVATFLVALGHGSLALFQFHALGDLNPFVSLLAGNTRYDSVAQFPFQPLGLLALLVLFLMAATSHDFWLASLSAPVWKALHMLVYAAYALVVAHVALGVLQAETSPLYAIALGAGIAWIAGLHLVAGFRERALDREPQRTPARDGFVEACALDAIPDGRARVVTLGGERVAIFKYDGRVSALSNVCQHQNGPLGEGRVVDGCVTCPWHGYQYLPDSGRSPEPFHERVPTFRVRIESRRVWIDPRPLPAGTRVEPARIEADRIETDQLEQGSARVAERGDDPFYVGYLPQAPAPLARFVRPRVVALFAFAAALALSLAAAQSPFAAAVFEYGVERSFEGVLREHPYPALVVERPGASAGASRYLLVSRGKHGAEDAVRGFDGRRVRLRGSLVFRDDRALVELSTAPIEPLGAASAPSSEPSELERGTYRGEIVDSKCFLGVMKPGNLKPHRDCAVRCISGGVPPVLLVRGADGRASYLLLAGSKGEAIGRELLDFVAEPVEIEGRVIDLGGQLALFADRSTLRRIE